MVWKKDLAKLKQDLKADEETTGPRKPVPKPAPKPAAPRELVDEDALFLAAMGARRSAGGESPASAAAPEKSDFTEAMATLKGLKPVQQAPLAEAKAPEPKAEMPAQEPALAEVPPLAEPAPEAVAPEPREEPAAARTHPVLINLAAGMAIDVDGTLDLRGHSPQDATERLKERVLDGHLLGWRTLHVQLGASDELRKALQAFLTGPEGELIARYAQAPVPMGGAQAWILYLGIQGTSTH